MKEVLNSNSNYVIFPMSGGPISGYSDAKAGFVKPVGGWYVAVAQAGEIYCAQVSLTGNFVAILVLMAAEYGFADETTFFLTVLIADVEGGRVQYCTQVGCQVSSSLSDSIGATGIVGLLGTLTRTASQSSPRRVIFTVIAYARSIGVRYD